MHYFPLKPTDTWHALRDCAGWEYHVFDTGPLARVLLHIVADPLDLLRHGERGAARASVRMVLRDGAVFGMSVTADRASMSAVLVAAGAALAGQSYDESAFSTLDATVAAALLAAGLGRARVHLDHQAGGLPRPVVTAAQLARLALGAVQYAHGEAAMEACPPAVLAQWERACAYTDPAVLAWRAALDAHACVVPDTLAVHNFIGAAGGHARNRAQALQALPWLLTMLTAPARSPQVPAIVAAIDAGLPLVDAVARAFDVPREVVRWLGRRPLPARWRLDALRLQRLLALLSWLPPERRPLHDADWDSLCAHARALSAPLDYAGASDEAMTLARMGPSMRRWLAQPRPDRAAELLDARDFLRALYEASQSIDGQSANAADARVLAWCAGIRVARLLMLSREWHAAMAAQASVSPGATADAHWPPVLARPLRAGDRSIVELTSRGQLQAEGQAMAHCVGSYAAPCVSGNSIVVALRDAAGAPVSTAELLVHDTAPWITIAQHRAAGNAAPGAACAQALRALLAHLDGPDQQAVLQRRRTFQREQRALQARAYRYNDDAQRAALRLAGTSFVAAPVNLAA